jgi:glucokinase
MFVGIEIGGTKLQLGLGRGDGKLLALERRTVDVAAGPDGIRRQIAAAVPELLRGADAERRHVRGVGIGFGGPVDDATHTVIRSHQIEGWDTFPLAAWISEITGWPAALGNDADVAGLAEALFGAGRGLSPVFYVTIGSGIGGGLIISGEVYRGCGRGAAEIGHLRVPVHARSGLSRLTVEDTASGWGMEQEARLLAEDATWARQVLTLAGGNRERIEVRHLGQAAAKGDEFARETLDAALDCLAEGVCHVIALLCPRRIVVGGGVSLLGEELFFEPLRRRVGERVFKPFVGSFDIVPAALGEEVVVHGALALARRRFGGSGS